MKSGTSKKTPSFMTQPDQQAQEQATYLQSRAQDVEKVEK